MKVIHLNTAQPVKTTTNSIIDLFTREKVTLKAIHNTIMGKITPQTQFTGFYA